MSVSSFAEVDGIPGPAKGQGQEGMIELFEFYYNVKVPTDPRDGSLAGRHKHGFFTITYEPGKHSPLIAKHLCDNIEIPRVVVHHYRHDEQNGDINEYFVHVLKKVKVVSFEEYKLNIWDPHSEPFRDMQKVSFVAEEYTMKESENNEHTDCLS